MTSVDQYQSSPTPKPTLHADNIPLEYAGLYQDLQSTMDDYQRHLLQAWDGNGFKNLTYAAGLSLADGSRGPDLWKHTTKLDILLTLDRFQQMGIQGVSINIPYPILAPDFPDSAQYLVFYRWLFYELQLRKFKTLVINLPLPEPEISGLRVKFYYNHLPDWESYLAARSEMMLLIAHELQPDYLTFAMNPEREERIVDPLQSLATQPYLAPDRYTAFAESAIQLINYSVVQVGARISTLDDTQTVQRLAAMPHLTYLDVDVSTIPNNQYSHTFKQMELISHFNKPVLIGDAWLLKSNLKPNQLPESTFKEAYRQNVFSFWTPLDQQFHELVVQTAHYYRVLLISPTWTRHYFAYLNYDVHSANLDVKALIELCEQQAIQKIKDGEFTPTAQRYQNLINPLTP